MRRLNVLWKAVLCAGLLLPLAARAQVIERNLPTAPTAPPAVIIGPTRIESETDDRTLVAALRQIVLLGAKDTALTEVVPGADAASLIRIGASVSDQALLDHALKRFVGRPLSRKRISRIEAAIVSAYRRAGRPFVDVSTPPQDISGGRLQIRIVEFRLGKVSVSGTSAADAGHVKSSLRAETGAPIDADLMSQDLDWLNRFPFRALSATFTPGAELGQTDLRLAAARTRPFSVYAGYANSGSPATGEDRYFIGGMVALPLLRDATLSYQLTGSKDFWDDHGRILDDPHPLYLSQGGRLLIPTAPRQDFELTVSAVETNQPSQAFVIRSVTTEASLGYRLAASNVWRVLPGDVNAGLDLKRQHRETLFGGVDAASGAVSVYQLFLGWSGSSTDRFGRASLDLAAHYSPGRVGRDDTDAAYAAFTQGRVGRADYAYYTADLNRTTQLPLKLALVSELAGQFSGQPLPDSERIPLGGAQSVRGFTLDDGAYDDGLTLRNELRSTGGALFQSGAVSLERPYLLADVGQARDEATHKDRTLAGVGLGAALRAGAASLAATLSDPLDTGPATHAGKWRVDLRLTTNF